MTDKARNKRRPSIYLSPPLARIADHLREGQSLSARLAEVAERYALVCEEPPELTAQERQLLGDTLSGSSVEPLLIKYLEHEIQDSDAGSQADLEALAARISAMSYAERVALIESLGF